MDTNTLQPESRAKLDGIVQQMVSNKESDTNIQAVVNDFKQKYGQPTAQTGTQPADNRNIAQKLGGAIYDPIVNMATRTGQAVGAVGLGIANQISGGALDKYTPEGNLTSAMQRAINTPVDVPILGTQVKPFNQETPESIGGQALGTVALGVGSPLLGGTLLGASGAMQNNEGVGGVVLNSVVGAVVGKLGEIGVKAAIPIISNIISKYGGEAVAKFEQVLPDYAKPYLEKAMTMVEEKTGTTLTTESARVKAGIDAATPNYNPKLIGDQPVTEGGLAIKGRKMVSTPSQIEVGTELSKTSSFDPNATALQNYQSVTQKEIPKIANQLDQSLKGEHVLRPPKEIMKVVSDAVNKAADESLLLQKTDPIVVNYLRVAQRAIDQSPGTLDGEWTVKKLLTQAYEKAGGKFSGNKALDGVYSSVNSALIKDMEANAQNTEVQAAMKQMSNLYDASDTLLEKAKTEGGTSWERFVKKHPQSMKLVPALLEGSGFGVVNRLIP